MGWVGEAIMAGWSVQPHRKNCIHLNLWRSFLTRTDMRHSALPLLQGSTAQYQLEMRNALQKVGCVSCR